MQSSGVEIRCQDSGKVCLTVREAGMILNSFRHHRSGRTRTGNRPRRKYWCSSCGYYHLTHLAFFGEKKKQKKWAEAVNF